MGSTMLTCMYIFFIDEFNTHITRKTMLTLEKIKQPLKNPAKPSEFEEGLHALINHSKKYILLFYHAVLTFLLTFDKKDFLTLLLLSFEAVIIPLHLHYYLKSNTSKSYIGPMYRLYLPIFAAAIFFVVFRYVLFFQKYQAFTQVRLLQPHLPLAQRTLRQSHRVQLQTRQSVGLPAEQRDLRRVLHRVQHPAHVDLHHGLPQEDQAADRRRRKERSHAQNHAQDV